MRITIFLISLLLTFNSANAQSDKIKLILSSEIQFETKVELDDDPNKIYLKTGFNSSDILNPNELTQIENSEILKIELVFTTFTSSQTFNQERLNRKRLQALRNIKPTLLSNEMIDWKVVGQTSCTSRESGYDFFHGFIITHRPSSIYMSRGNEIDYLKKVLAGKDPYAAETEIEIAQPLSILPFSMDSTATYASSESVRIPSIYFVSDSTVIKVLERNQNWNKMLVVCDLTASMSPYTAQLLVWHKLNIKSNGNRAKHFTFFNDGNLKPTSEKHIGKTGGIYHGRAENFEDIRDLAFKTMKAGYGGDNPENNVEALISAIEKCYECNDVVMIADNLATPRDLALISEVNKPVKIILCGLYGNVNPAYLDLARKTNGSVHTIEEDINSLMDLNEGEEIQIGPSFFTIRNGRFVSVNRT